MITAGSEINSTLRKEAISQVEKNQGTRMAKLPPEEYIKAVAKKFIELQLDAFPFYCEVARIQNKLKQDELFKYGHKGKYTDTYGWSEDGTMKHDFEIPNELYLFMVNLVYSDFWSEENEKVWRTFMKRVCRGDRPEELLIWVKTIYGSNSQQTIVTTG